MREKARGKKKEKEGYNEGGKGMVRGAYCILVDLVNGMGGEDGEIKKKAREGKWKRKEEKELKFRKMEGETREDGKGTGKVRGREWRHEGVEYEECTSIYIVSERGRERGRGNVR